MRIWEASSGEHSRRRRLTSASTVRPNCGAPLAVWASVIPDVEAVEKACLVRSIFNRRIRTVSDMDFASLRRSKWLHTAEHRRNAEAIIAGLCGNLNAFEDLYETAS